MPENKTNANTWTKTRPKAKYEPNGLPSFALLNRRGGAFFVNEKDLKTPASFIVKKLLKWAAYAAVPLFLYFYFFAYWDLPSGCRVTIYPSWSQFNNRTVIKGIKYLKQNHPQNYADFCSLVKTIDPNISCGGVGGGCYSSFNVAPKTIDISTNPGDVKGAAGVIAHETCHAKQYSEQRAFDETECYQVSDMIIYGYSKH